MPRVWLSLGSNLNREASIRGAVQALAQRFAPLLISTVYESDAVGFDGGRFYNLVVGFDTEQPHQTLMSQLRQIETDFGRQRGSEKFSSRILDIDLLTYGDEVYRGEKYELPRDEIPKYSFVLCPLAEMAPEQCHPVTGESFAVMWEGFDQRSQPLWPIAFDFGLSAESNGHHPRQ